MDVLETNRGGTSAWLRGLLLLASVALIAAAPPGVANQVPAQNPPPAAGGSVMDSPLRLVAEAAQTYQGLRDYSCMFVKREQVNGQLQPENLVQMKARTQPFSVYMRWLAPKTLAGQEVCFVAGRNNGMMRVHSPGFLGVVGFVNLDPRDPRAMETNRHTINDAGIGNLIELLRRNWEQERTLNQTQVQMAEYEFNKRKCIRVETLHPNRAGGQFYCYRGVAYFDKETHLPIRFEAYDWPRQGGDPSGDILECYSYVDLKLNVGTTEADFRK